jgi:diaminohydroxyphosphoribosylaminopyrimidine deaminase / 5-amino-6-(5-phosphoribosylamino)uracil reductase
MMSGMDQRQIDAHWMGRAIELAQKAWGQTHPNPHVGAILAGADGKIISEGYHLRAGEQHAERMALSRVNLTPDQVRGASLYITLEPCCTHGRTPPCTDIILEKGVKRVVIGTIDPNPSHRSRGIDLLRSKGVEVVTHVLEAQCRALNPVFNHRMLHPHPMLAVKVASTLDGKIATRSGQSKWITSPESRQHAMRWRQLFPAIAVGAGTALADDPSLTVREQGQAVTCPTRLVFDRSLRTAGSVEQLQVYNDDWREKTCLITSVDHTASALFPFQKRGVSVLQFDYRKTPNDFPLEDFRGAMQDRGIQAIYVEGGPSLIQSFLYLHAVDYLFQYIAPKLFADSEAYGFAAGIKPDCPDAAPFIHHPCHTTIGDDFLIHGPVHYPSLAQ